MTEAAVKPAPAVAPVWDAETLLAAALQLPPKERELLADQLWESVDRDADLPMTEEGFVDGYALLGPKWMEEIERRIAAYERGEVETIDGEEVFARLRARRST
jgi:hypothetical protein